MGGPAPARRAARTGALRGRDEPFLDHLLRYTDATGRPVGRGSPGAGAGNTSLGAARQPSLAQAALAGAKQHADLIPNEVFGFIHANLKICDTTQNSYMLY